MPPQLEHSQTPVPEQHFANNNNHPSPIPGGFLHEGEPTDTADDGISHKRGERV